MVAMEAMGAGRPVLVSTRGGMIEFVKDKITGYHLTEPMTADTIAEDITRVMLESDLPDTAQRGQQYVFKNYSWSAVTQRFEEVICNWFE